MYKFIISSFNILINPHVKIYVTYNKQPTSYSV
jgi:hypothetical protein